jgi:hypothetical protein
MLQWIICSRRPLHVDELLEAIAFTVEDDYWDTSKIPMDPTRLIRASVNLIVIDEEDHCVQLAHYTVQQFLFAPSEGPGSPYHFTREAAELYVGETCIIYLSFKDFDTQLVKYTNRTNSQMSAIEKALLGSDSIVQGGLIESATLTVSNLLRPSRSYKPSNIDFSHHIPHPSSGLQCGYQLLGYVIKEWLHHTRQLDLMAHDQNVGGMFQEGSHTAGI